MKRYAGGAATAAIAVVALGLASLTTLAEGIAFSRLEDPAVDAFRREFGSYSTVVDAAAKNLTTTGTFDKLKWVPRTMGYPGAVVFDVDGDGDLDIFVAAGPGQEHALFLNTLVPEGTFGMTTSCGGQSCAAEFGLAFPDRDGNAMCAGDIDNDGDQDLVILNLMHPAQLLRNDGGSFTELSIPQEAALDFLPTACAFGDVDNDGLVDLVIVDFPLRANATRPKNSLLMNKGPEADSHFVDETDARGLGSASLNYTWGLALVDYDKDGDIDIFYTDELGFRFPIADFALIHLWQNDGSGNFRLVPKEESGLESQAFNMGIIMSDFNCDGSLDLYVTKGGGIEMAMIYMELGITEPEIVVPLILQESAQIAFGSDNGSFEVGIPMDTSGTSLHPPFGWGVLAEDFDNDGDADLTFTGGFVYNGFNVASPGVVLENNDCTGMFTVSDALKDQDFNRYIMSGLAAGDLNDDGFMDFVAAAGAVIPKNATLMKIQSVSPDFLLEAVNGSPFLDDVNIYFTLIDPEFNQVYGGPLDKEGNPVLFEKGLVSIEMNNASNGNNWVKIKLRGSVGDVDGAKVNRDGTGAVISFTPNGGTTSTVPLESGIIHGSSDKTKIFGLGSESEGELVVMWPGKIFNTLKVFAGERLVIPEIPCSIVNFDGDEDQFRECLSSSLATLMEKGVIDDQMQSRLSTSMMKAYVA